MEDRSGFLYNLKHCSENRTVVPRIGWLLSPFVSNCWACNFEIDSTLQMGGCGSKKQKEDGEDGDIDTPDFVDNVITYKVFDVYAHLWNKYSTSTPVQQ